MAAVSVSETSPELAPLLAGGAAGAVANGDDGEILPAAIAATARAESGANDDGANDGDADGEGEGGKKKKKKKKKNGDDDEAPVDENGATISLAQYGDYGTLSGPQRKASKAVADILKTEMAAERTFFKWLWTGLHTGAIGSIIFAIFDSRRDDPARLLVIGFSWLVALALVLYGALVYYRRRAALRSGNIDAVPRFTREHSPAVVVVALVAVVSVSMTYAIFSREPGAAATPGLAGNATGAGAGAGGAAGGGIGLFGLRLREPVAAT